MHPLLIAALAVGMNVPLIVLLVGSVTFMKWSFGDEPYTSLSMLLGIVFIPFGIGLMTIYMEVRKNYKNRIQT
jgi:putative effector of murein hydrolase LrgA (UPF0299 family)